MIELYINNSLCDVGSDFNVRLNRQLINPGELNTKDAQYSYSITLPSTANNHIVFNHANVEETRGKFNREYTADLIINSVRVFTGLFRLSEITNRAYKGNLYVPSAKSVKDIFGETKLNENARYPLDFSYFVQSVNGYNVNAAVAPQKAIFPYTLYGLLPKKPFGTDGGYTAKTVWDDTVYLDMSSMPPSINVLGLIRHLFNSKGYKISGTAFDDDRLNSLYMSYRNDPTYIQPWNYGRHGLIQISGKWCSTRNMRTGISAHSLPNGFEKGVNQNSDAPWSPFICDLLDATNTSVSVSADPGNNVVYTEVEADNDPHNRTFARCQIQIPVSGYYKVILHAGVKVITPQWRATDKTTGVQHVSGRSSSGDNRLLNRMYEIRLMRDWGSRDFGLSTAKLDGVFYYDNQPQTQTFEGESGFDTTRDIPKYFPQIVSPSRGQLMFVDPAQDKNIVAGMSFGTNRGCVISGSSMTYDAYPDKRYINPQESPTPTLAIVQVAKPAKSWNTGVDVIPRLATPSPGYMGYGYENNIDPDDTAPPTGDTIAWFPTERYKIDITAPASVYNSAVRGFYDANPDDANLTGTGQCYAVCWFEKGEMLTLASVSASGIYRNGNMDPAYGWTEHEITFQLTLEAFQPDPDWLKVDLSGNGTAAMSWNDPTGFDVNEIDLVKFLPADVKTDDFIENFCKAFNLRLSQVNTSTFELAVKQAQKAVNDQFINLDNLASVRDRANTPLGLPSLYRLGFTVDEEEEGYVTTLDDGGGEFTTDATEEKIVEQKSSFSYNWFKDILKVESGGNIALPLAVISKHDVWDISASYPEAGLKKYTDQALRFWYYDGLLNALGATFPFGTAGQTLKVAKVSNVLPGRNALNYKNQKLTILDNYFTLLINGDSHYTEIEGYLTPELYENLNGSATAMFNGDLYYVAELSGYDPTGRNKTKIKLIRKI